ncbi:hypothetical protein J1TS3_15180 [Siminovitchia fordii]|uniref:Uncharacterized protein n=1 Tax=Siminovitchia fordii TaxID=254759 RepID=A0ABQ4K3S4_9BACI|nr:hypothetical protein J1TS3_15180 [Siminovitchia fordii]
MKRYWYSISGVKTRLNKAKVSGGCPIFSEEIYCAELDKIRTEIRQGAFDKSEGRADSLCQKQSLSHLRMVHQVMLRKSK